jgi:teichoic acid transport system ATP-binding protein
VSDAPAGAGTLAPDDDLSDATVVADDVHVTYRVPVGDGRVGGRLFGGAIDVRAVDGITLVARRGESIGVVGANGSGKSTFLRAVAGLTPPTRGQVMAVERPVLLGVNAAMVQGVSGARNIVLGGLALGLTRKEIDAKYDEVVELAGIGDAIHRPMAGYSSGMQARLKFAITTMTRPHVLLVDEALNTGDQEFKERSSERIKELLGDAGTVFLVSHSVETVRDICSRAVWFDRGRMWMDGPADEIADLYRDQYRAGKAARLKGLPPPPRPWEEGHPLSVRAPEDGR